MGIELEIIFATNAYTFHNFTKQYILSIQANFQHKTTVETSTFSLANDSMLEIKTKGQYIKYVEEGAGGFLWVP